MMAHTRQECKYSYIYLNSVLCTANVRKQYKRPVQCFNSLGLLQNMSNNLTPLLSSYDMFQTAKLHCNSFYRKRKLAKCLSTYSSSQQKPRLNPDTRVLKFSKLYQNLNARAVFLQRKRHHERTLKKSICGIEIRERIGNGYSSIFMKTKMSLCFETIPKKENSYLINKCLP